MSGHIPTSWWAGCARCSRHPRPIPFAQEVVAVPTRGIERWLTQRIAAELADRTSGDGGVRQRRVPLPASPRPGSAASGSRTGFCAGCLGATRFDLHLGLGAGRSYGRALDVAPGPLHRCPECGRRARQQPAPPGGPQDRRTVHPLRPAPARDGPGLDGGGGRGSRWKPPCRGGRVAGAPVAAGPGADRDARPGGIDPVGPWTRSGAARSTVGLPERIFVYGLTSVDPMDVEVFEAVASTRDVHLHLLHPSPVLWLDTAVLAERDGVDPGSRRASDPTAHLPRHPLLRSWAQESRELQLVLASRDHESEPSVGASGPAAATLLGRLQHDIRSNALPAHRRGPGRRRRRRDGPVGPDPRLLRRPPGRWRFCATPSSTCSRPIPRSNPAMS